MGVPSVRATPVMQRPTSPVDRMRNQWVDQQMSTPTISANIVNNFTVLPNVTTKGIDVSFALGSVAGVKYVTLLRATVLDIKQAVVLQTWAPHVSTFTWSDTDKAMQTAGQAYYWVRLSTLNTNGADVEVGPQYTLLNPSLLAPLDLTAISASHAALSNGVVLVTCNTSAVPTGDTVKIAVSGYEGNPAYVEIAQNSTSPLQFNLQQTGETVTLKAIATSSGGVEAASGPTCTLVLNTSLTVPAQVLNVTCTQISSGNQLSWPASLEADVTSYGLYRNQRGLGFGSATLLATISASGAGTVLYLDTGGLAGDYEYYVVAVGGAGSSPASPAVNPLILFSSSQLPPNTPSNQIGGATIDSVDGGASASIRIYGPGGVGTSWTKATGYGNITRPGGSATGLAYGTQYYVFYNVVGNTYLASATYTDTLTDAYEWVGTLTTCPVGGPHAATASCGVSGGVVVGAGITDAGYGYGSATATFSGGGGSGAAASVTCAHGYVTGLALTSGGGGYTSAPTITINKTSDYFGGGPDGSSRYQLTSPI